MFTMKFRFVSALALVAWIGVIRTEAQVVQQQDKAAIRNQWSERRAHYLKTIEELRSNRRKMEQKRTDVESQVLERYFQ